MGHHLPGSWGRFIKEILEFLALLALLVKGFKEGNQGVGHKGGNLFGGALLHSKLPEPLHHAVEVLPFDSSLFKCTTADQLNGFILPLVT